MKFCKDCEHRIKQQYENRYGIRSYYYKCTLTRTDRPANVVTGHQPIPMYEDCSMEREHEHLCGPEAKFFKPRKPWWKRIFK